MPTTVPHGEHKNEMPFTRTDQVAPSPHPADPNAEIKHEMLKWARWSIVNRAHATYTEGPRRWDWVTSRPGSLEHLNADCSSWVTAIAKWGGASDPNGLRFKGGYTGTLLQHCNHIPAAHAKACDLIVYGAAPGKHAVLITEVLPEHDFRVASHGHQGDPGSYLHSSFVHYFGWFTVLRWLS